MQAIEKKAAAESKQQEENYQFFCKQDFDTQGSTPFWGYICLIAVYNEMGEVSSSEVWDCGKLRLWTGVGEQGRISVSLTKELLAIHIYSCYSTYTKSTHDRVAASRVCENPT